jgi:hypothetical protein
MTYGDDDDVTHGDDDDLQAAVPKYLKLEMFPPSSTSVPALGGGLVTQEIKVTNSSHGDKNIMLKLKLAYSSNGVAVSHHHHHLHTFIFRRHESSSSSSSSSQSAGGRAGAGVVIPSSLLAAASVDVMMMMTWRCVACDRCICFFQ